MRICPVCGGKCNSLQCSRCGFDGSQDYESLPTLTLLDKPVVSLAKRKAELSDRPRPILWKRLLVSALLCALMVLAVVFYHPRNGWFEKSGRTYYYEDGQKAVGFRQIGEHTYYFSEDIGNHMITGLWSIGEEIYLFNSDGVMQTGWQQLSPEDDRWFYFDVNGVYQKGWITIDGKTYYVDDMHGRVTGLKQISQYTYYFDQYGVMQTNCTVYIDGNEYVCDSTGCCYPSPNLEEETGMTVQETPEQTHPPEEPTSGPETTPAATTPAIRPPATTAPTTDPKDDPNWFMCITCVGRGEIWCECVYSGNSGLCSICGGTGIYHMIVDHETMETTVIDCYYCGGSKVCPVCHGINSKVRCEECAGKGGYYWTP